MDIDKELEALLDDPLLNVSKEEKYYTPFPNRLLIRCQSG